MKKAGTIKEAMQGVLHVLASAYVESSLSGSFSHYLLSVNTLPLAILYTKTWGFLGLTKLIWFVFRYSVM